MTLSFFWKFYKPHKLSLCFYFILAGWVGLHGLFNSYLTKIIIDSLENPLKNLLLPALFIVGNYELHNLCWRGVNYLNLRLTPIVKNDVTEHLFGIVHGQSYRFFQETLSGSIASNISILTDHLEKIASNISVRLVRGSVQLLASLFVMGWIHPLFSGAFFLWTTFFVSFSLFFSKKIRSLSNEVAMHHSLVSGKIVDSVSNAASVRIFSGKRFEISLLKRSLDLLKKAFQNKELFLLKFYFVQGVSITCLMGFIIFTLIKLKMAGSVTTGDFAFILGVSLYLTDMVWSNTELIDQLNDGLGKCNQSLKALLATTLPKQKKEGKPLVVKKGEITFENVHFYYHPKAPLFIDKSLTIPAGQKVGIVGHSGGGKSTFINLLLRLYDVKQGRILIDGQDIREVTQASIHESIGVIPQDPSLFHRSLLENIRYGKTDAQDDAVILAAKKARVDEYIAYLEEGYGTLLGERGIKLSGGQRQRIAIARVILKNAPILILDEPTSELDTITENDLKEAFFSLMQNKTTIVIAHRLSTLIEMDRILVFEQGKIIEDGSHESLLGQEGTYKKLWDMNKVLDKF